MSISKSCLIISGVFYCCNISATDERYTQSFSQTLNYYSQYGQWGSSWGGALDLLNGGHIYLDSTSSQPKGFISKIYDGNLGSLDDPTGSYLIFDTRKAAFRVVARSWRIVNSIDMYVLESAKNSRANAKINFVHSGGKIDSLKFIKKTIAVKNNVAQVEYKSEPRDFGGVNGEFMVVYDNPDFSSAFVSEIILNELGVKKKENLATSKNNESDASLEFWDSKKFVGQSGRIVHSLVFKTEASGDRFRDLASAWLIYSNKIKSKSMPLLVIISGTGDSDLSLELMGIMGRPEFGIVPEIIEAGFGVFVINLPTLMEAVEKGKKIEKILNRLKESSIPEYSGINFNFENIGIWGYGKNAFIAMVAAKGDKRYRTLGLSRPNLCIDVTRPKKCTDSEASDSINLEMLETIADRKIIIWGDLDVELANRLNDEFKNIEIRRHKNQTIDKNERRDFIDFMKSQHMNFEK